MNSGYEDHVSKVSFRPGSIHEAEYLDFWKGTLKASSWVLETLVHGYKIPFEATPGDYEEDNNASAKREMKVVRKIVAEMIEQSIVKVVKTKPKCVSPLGLVTKKLENGDLKHRLVFDASRWVNGYIKDQKVTLAHLEKALELTEKGDWQVIFDLKSAFYHIKIAEDHQTFLGASITNSDGSRLYFVYKHLPFGLKCAVHAITKIWKPLTCHLQKLGIRSTIYIDDGRLLAKSAEEAENNRLLAYEIIRKAGWIIEKDKSDKKGEAACVKNYLGFVIDSNTMMVSKKDDKLKEIIHDCEALLNLQSPTAKELSSVIGKMAALIPSHGHIARFSTRSSYVAIAELVEKEGWNTRIPMSDKIRKEITFFIKNAMRFNGYPIKNALTSVRVETIFPNAKASKNWIVPVKSMISTRMASDSSCFKAAIIHLDNLEEEQLEFTFTDEERALSSGVRELLAVYKAVAHWKSSNLFFKKLIFWATDSTNVVSFLEKGSSKKHVQKLILDLAVNLAEMGSWIQPVHLYRDDDRIRVADGLSKAADSDDWSIDESNFQQLKREFNLSVDLFASATNARLPLFYTKIYEQGCAGVNAFSMTWNHGLWICPPVSLLPKIANEIRSRRYCSGVVICPEWPTASFYGKFFDCQGTREPFKLEKKIEPYIFQNQGAKGPLNGKISFKLCVLSFTV